MGPSNEAYLNLKFDSPLWSATCLFSNSMWNHCWYNV